MSSTMLLQSRFHFLLLVYLTSSVLGNPSDFELECGEDTYCSIFGQLASAVNEIKNQLNKLDTTVNGKLDKQDAKLDKQNAKLDEQDAKLHKQGTQLNEQSKDLEVLKTDVNRSLASTASISTQLERHSTDLQSHDGRLKAHDVLQRNEYQLTQNIYGADLGPRDCSDIRERGYNVSGVYRVYPGSDNRRIEADVYCNFNTPGQSWLVFQRRRDGSINFERVWKDYAAGFGDLNGEFWLGNEKLSLLTMNRKYKMRVELEDFEKQKRYAEYTIFSVKPITDKYRLTVGGYSGNAGDSMAGSHNNMQFTTKDVDNDLKADNCAVAFRGAWWYNACHSSNLNGLYLGGSHTSRAQGMEWYSWHGHYYSYKTTEMKIAAI